MRQPILGLWEIRWLNPVNGCISKEKSRRQTPKPPELGAIQAKDAAKAETRVGVGDLDSASGNVSVRKLTNDNPQRASSQDECDCKTLL